MLFVWILLFLWNSHYQAMCFCVSKIRKDPLPLLQRNWVGISYCIYSQLLATFQLGTKYVDATEKQGYSHQGLTFPACLLQHHASKIEDSPVSQMTLCKQEDMGAHRSTQRMSQEPSVSANHHHLSSGRVTVFVFLFPELPQIYTKISIRPLDNRIK